MNVIRIIAAAALAALTAHSASAPAQAAGPTRVAVCNSLAFKDPKQGITRLVNAHQALEREFQPDFNGLQEMETRIQTLGTAMAKNQRDIGASSPLSDAHVALVSAYDSQTKEYGKLGRDFKFRQEDAKSRYATRNQAVIGPIEDDIHEALREYARKMGITLLLDQSKMSDMVMAVGEVADVTNDFIVFYNSRAAAVRPVARVTATGNSRSGDTIPNPGTPHR